VSRELSGTALLLVGAMLVRLTVTDVYQRYVRVGMGPLLLGAGVLLLALGLVTLVAAFRGVPETEDAGLDHTGHDHAGHDHAGHAPGGARVGWLLLAPVLALLLVAPPALGSYGVGRTTTVDVRTGHGTFAALEAGAGPVTMTLLEFDQRAQDRAGGSFGAVPVRLTGFVAAPAEGGFRLARYQIACCAADAVAAVVDVRGITGDPPARDAWVSVIGTFRPGADPDQAPVLEVSSVQPVAVPVDPYE
jgi:uncharacterized repeat protein (TIGR03943 family)